MKRKKNPVLQYLWFCLAVITLFSVYAYYLDLIYYKIDYGTAEDYQDNMIGYGGYFLILFFPFSIIVPVLYNLIVNEAINYLPYKAVIRFLFGIGVGLSIGLLMKRNGVSFYIGDLRPQKEIILYTAIGFSVEVIRLIKINYTRMKKNKTVVLSFLMLIFCNASKAQNECLPDSVLNTDSVGNLNDKLEYPLRFLITKDSILVYNAESRRQEFLAFKIIEREKCQWNTDFSEGISSYKLSVESKGIMKYPLLNIIYKTPKLRYIELLYENSEERIFTIKSPSN